MRDIIVVGGGPAGASAARRCAQLGLSTLLIDRAVFPRDKLCGGAVSEYGLSHFDFPLPAELIEREIFGARMHFGESITEVRKPRRLAITVSRMEFDHFLLKQAEAAGAEVLQGRPVSALTPGSRSITVSAGPDRFDCRIVIGCDGFNSLAARYVRRGHTPSEYGNCMEVYVPADEGEIDRHLNGVIHVHLGIARGGYGWVFPHKGYFAVGIGGEARYVPRPRQVLTGFLNATGFVTEATMRGWPIPSGGVRRETVTDRIVLAGDAAGFVDPFTGEGIGFAVRSGQLAAEAAAQAIRSGDTTRKGLRPYAVNCDHEFGENLRYSRWLSHLMHRFPKFFLRLMASQPQAVERYVEERAHQQSYRAFFAWLLPRLPGYWLAMRAQK